MMDSPPADHELFLLLIGQINILADVLFFFPSEGQNYCNIYAEARPGTDKSHKLKHFSFAINLFLNHKCCKQFELIITFLLIIL